MAGRLSIGAVQEPEHLTKARLKLELERFGIDYEPNESKSYYVQRYKDQVLEAKSVKPVRRTRSEFSSDDDIRSQREFAALRAKKLYKKVSADSYLDEVQKFTDSELVAALKKHSVEVGPIMDTTRLVYQRKLAGLMFEDSKKKQTSSVEPREEEQNESYSDDYSDNEELESIDYEPPVRSKPQSYSNLVAPATFSPTREHSKIEAAKSQSVHIRSGSSQVASESPARHHDDTTKVKSFRKRLNIDVKPSTSSPRPVSQSLPPKKQRISWKIFCQILTLILAAVIAFIAYIVYAAPELLPQIPPSAQWWK